MLFLLLPSGKSEYHITISHDDNAKSFFEGWLPFNVSIKLFKDERLAKALTLRFHRPLIVHVQVFVSEKKSLLPSMEDGETAKHFSADL